MSNTPNELFYTKSHEWVRIEDDGTFTIGISDHAQELLGDIVYIELPEVGSELDAEQDCAVIESVKAASDLYTPVAGTVIAINEELEDSPETINGDAYGEGWIFKLQPFSLESVKGLMQAEEYSAMVAEDEE
ncbi:MAG: glycine cleavage system protein GcvH [Gammaproteobacteria bacterium]|nr:glycine cleavage system protein GcvH [Gammaproteobacteria bacterium]MCF6231290.1 glycine cleavage system protein GcvH [Gammaproteobacteria bacterium]